MGAGDAPGGAYFTDDYAGFHEVAGLYVDFGEVAVEGVDAQAVIDQDGVAREVELLGEHHAAALARVDRSAGQGGNIDAGVRRAWLAIQDAAAAEVLARG